MIWSRNMERPTEEEQARIDAMMNLGCILTRIRGMPAVTAECHHIVVGGKRMGALYTIPLNPWYHRGVCLPGRSVSAMKSEFGPALVHGSKAFFKGHQVTEHDLWKIVQKTLGLPTDAPLSKIVRRRIELTDDWG